MQFRGVNICHIETNNHGRIFAEFIELLKQTLAEIGIDTLTSKNQLSGDRLNILVGHTAFLPDDFYQALSSSGVKYIVFQMEALDESEGFAPKKQSYVEFLKTGIQIWDYSPTNRPFLERRDCSSIHHIPIGFSNSLKRINHAAKKDIDVLFYGAQNQRRAKILESLGSKGIRVANLFGGYENERDQAIARAKITINIHQFETSHLEEIRIAYLLNNQCFVISEKSDRDPFGGGVVFANYNDLAERCVQYLQPGMEEERESIAAAGFENLKSVPMRERIQASLCMLPFGS